LKLHLNGAILTSLDETTVVTSVNFLTFEDGDKEETRKVVAGFVGDVLRGENPDKLTSYYDGDKYIQHNTSIADMG